MLECCEWRPGRGRNGRPPVRRRLLALVASVLVASVRARKDPPPPPPPRKSAGPNFNLFPNDPRLRIGGYASATIDKDAARFSRPGLGAAGVAGAAGASPGVTISFRTDAPIAYAVFEYGGPTACSARCPTLPTGGCYATRPCANQCEVRVEVDGVPSEAPAAHSTLAGAPIVHSDRPDEDARGFLGEVKVAIAGGGAGGGAHTYVLRLPWGAPVAFKRLHLEGTAAQRPSVLDAPATPSVRFVALGDSITAGLERWDG